MDLTAFGFEKIGAQRINDKKLYSIMEVAGLVVINIAVLT